MNALLDARRRAADHAEDGDPSRMRAGRLAARKTRLRQELDQATAEHKDVKARRVEAEGAEKAARPAQKAAPMVVKAAPMSRTKW